MSGASELFTTTAAKAAQQGNQAMTISQDLSNLRAEAASIQAKARQIHERRSALASKLATITALLTSAAEAAASARAALTAAMTAEALGAGTQEATAEARNRLASASEKVGEGHPSEIEAEALQAAISTLDAELTELSTASALLVEKERELVRRRLDEMAADAQRRHKDAAEQLALAIAEETALSHLAEECGCSAALYAPYELPNITLQSVGPGRIERPLFTLQPRVLLPGARDAAVGRLRSEGFTAI
jgi:chromosome segregation ATPase